MEPEMAKLVDMIAKLNEIWNEMGHSGKFVIGNDNIKVTEEEVIITLPVKMTMSIKRDGTKTKSFEAISPAVSHPVSPAVSERK